MSTTVDKRVVEMRFDNKQFENNVQISMSTIDKLKHSLNMTGASKGLENVSSAAKNCDMSGLSNAVQTVQAKFSALQVMAVTALANITNSAVNTGKKIVSALTIDPIRTGFQEYETQINAVQTILANTSSKGTTLNQVNAALDELNTYADKTIYNFTEMTKNIGTFTAAGVELKTSVEAIKGIANLAAVSGSNAQQASTAMYQLSQALSSGTVKLMDWNSVVNAGMGGQVFQDSLKETARVHGIAIDDMIMSEGSFRETLQNGWLSSEILTETLAKFTGDLSKAQLESMGYTKDQIVEIMKLGEMANDAATKVKTFTQLCDTLKEAAQSGWSQSWKLIVGDFEEAKKLWTDMSNVLGEIIGDSADARNKMLSGGLSSGWDQFLHKGIADEAGYIDAIKEVAKEHNIVVDNLIKDGETFEDSLKQGWLTSDIMSESLKKLTAKTKGLSDEELENLGYTQQMVDELQGLNTSVQNGTISVDDFTKKMTMASGREHLIEALSNSFTGLMSVITPISQAFREIFREYTGEQLYALTEKIGELTKNFKLSDEASANLKSTFKGLFAVLSIVKQAFSAVFTAIGPLFGGLENLGGGILGVTASFGDWLVGLNDTIKKTDVFNNIVQGVMGFVDSAATAIKNFVKSISDKFDFPGFETFHSFLERTHERMSQVGDAAGEMKYGVITAVDMMGESLANSKFMQMLQSLWDGVKTIAGGIVSAFGSLTSGIIEKISDADFKGTLDIINSLITGGIGVGLMKFIKTLTKVTNEGTGVIGGIKNIKDAIVDTFSTIQTQLKAETLIKIASAIAILAASILVISLIDSKKLTASLGAIIVLFADLMVSMSLFGKISGNLTGVFKTCTGMVSISIAILILSSALKNLGNLNFKQMATGLVGVIGLTATMVAATEIMGNSSKTVIKGAAQMVIFAAAIKILASACKELSMLSWEQFAKGLVGVGVLLAETSLFLNTAKFNGKSIVTATGIVILASAIRILASACEYFGQMEWGEIGKGLAAIGVLLAGITIFTNLTGNAKHVISTGTALIAIGAAMKIFASAVADFSGMQWGELVKGLIALGGSMAILAIGLNSMTGTLAGSAALIVAVAALALFTPILSILGAMSWEGIAKGLIAIAGAFTVIGVASLVLIPLVPAILALGGAFALIGVGILGIGAGLLAAGAGLSAVAVGFTALAAAGIAGATAVVASLTVIITGVASLIPAVIEKIGEGIIAFCDVIAGGASAISKAVKSIALNIIDAFVEIAPQLINGIIDILSCLFSAIEDNLPKFIDNGKNIIISLLKGIRDNANEVISVVVEIIEAFVTSVSEQIPKIIESAIDLIVNFINALGEAIETETPRIVDSIIGLGGNIVQGLINGLLDGIEKIASTVRNIGTSMLDTFKDVLGINSPSKEFMHLGEYIGDGLIIGINNRIVPAVNATNNLTQQILSISKKSIKEFESWLSDKKYFNEISLTQELEAWEAVQKRYLNGSEERKKADKEVYRIQNELVSETYKESMKWIEDEKYYKQLSLASELAAYERVQKRYLKGSEERKKADKEVFKLQNEVNEAQQKYYSDMEIIQEDNVSMRIDLEEEYAAKVKNINDTLIKDIQSLNDQYESQLKSRTSTLYNLYGLFDKAKGVKDISGDTLVENLKSQVEEFDTWENTMDNLAGRGLDSNLMEELEKMGPSTLGELKAISSMTDEQLSQYTELWKKKHSQAKDQAVGELQELRANTNLEIEKLRQQSEIDLTEYRMLWSKQMQELTSDTTQKVATITEEFAKLGLYGIDSLASNIDTNSDKIDNSMGELLKSAITSIKDEQTEINKSGENIITELDKGLKSKESLVSATMTKVLRLTLVIIKNTYQSFHDAGRYLVEGFAYGISANTYLAEARARAMAAAASRAAKNELDEHSPSKVGYRIGDFFGMAFVNAISDYESKAYNAGSRIANSAKKGLNKAISKISEVINNDIDTQPTIRPVLDLSNIEKGSKQLNTIFSRNQVMDINTTMSRRTTDEIQNGESLSSIGNSYQFVQNNYSPKALSRLEIYRQTKNQFSAMKGFV